MFCTCPICNALVKLFDPQNPGQYVDFCDLCKALYNKLENIKGQNEALILFSHQLIPDMNQLHALTQSLLSSEKIKKIYILEVEYEKISKPIPSILDAIIHKRLKKSEFYELLEANKFEYRVIFEVFKDKITKYSEN